MKKINLVFFTVLITLLCAGCNNSDELDINDYSSVIKNTKDGLNNIVTRNELSVEMQYIPWELVALNSVDDLDSLKDNYSDFRTQYENAEYYEVTIWHNSKPTKEYLKSLVNASDNDFEVFLSFGMQSRFALIINSDTVPCSFLHREISEGITNKIKYSLVFNTTDDNGDRKQFDRKILLECPEFGLENIELSVDRKTINSAPKLKL